MQKVCPNSIQQESTEYSDFPYTTLSKHFDAKKNFFKILWLQVAYNLIAVIYMSIGKQQRR